MKLDWFRLASHLGQPLAVVQSLTPMSVFVQWMEYLKVIKIQEDLTTTSKLDYYLAQIAAEIRRTAVKNPLAIKIEQMLLSFRFGRKKEKSIGTSKEKVEVSKSFWCGISGLIRKRNK